MVVRAQSTYLSLLCCGLLSVVSQAQIARAQDICSSDDVQSAISDMPCIADGAYLSPTDLAQSVGDQCGNARDERGCRRCFRKSFKRLGRAIKDLSRAGAIDPGFLLDVRSAFVEAQDEVCSSIGDDPNTDLPDPAPSPEPTPPVEPSPTFEPTPPADPNPPVYPTYPSDPTPSETPAYGGSQDGSHYNPYYPPFNSGGWRHR
jgi:hypothetical protein